MLSFKIPLVVGWLVRGSKDNFSNLVQERFSLTYIRTMVGTNERATFVCVCVLCEMNSDIKVDVKRLKQERKPTLD